MFTLVEREHKNIYFGWTWKQEYLLLDVNTRIFTWVEREHKNVYFGWMWTQEYEL